MFQTVRLICRQLLVSYTNAAESGPKNILMALTAKILCLTVGLSRWRLSGMGIL
jgi:hypothetical protein